MNTLAVVISYNNPAALISTVEALVEQVEKVLIIDNHSNENEFQKIQTLNDHSKVKIQRLNDNEGVGYALNLGLNYASENGYELMLTMDQDTILGASAVDALKELMHDETTLLAAPEGKRSWLAKKLFIKFQIVITSGNLVNVSLAKKIGGYNAAMFIDCIDIEFCLRGLLAGFKIATTRNTWYNHQLGETKTLQVLGRKKDVSVHSSKRLYYMTRNHLLVARKYFVYFPFYISWKSINLIKQLFINFLFSKFKKEALSMMFKGFQHGISRQAKLPTILY